MNASIPIFVISYNRGTYLSRVIASYKRQTVPIEIIIHDFGSTEPETLSMLSDLEAAGIRVVRAARIFTGKHLDLVNHTVGEYFRNSTAQTRYVVTDCDVDLTIASIDSLSIYSQFLDRFPGAECVGPMIRIVDVQKSFPLYNRVMNRHIEQFWHKEPEWMEIERGDRVAYQVADIDTTFALHRENAPFRRLKHGIRTYFPYEAQHLDWYQTPQDLQNSPYYQRSFEGIGNWSNKISHERYSGVELEHSEFVYVAYGADGRLERKVHSLR